ncbi:DUF2304 domain-containing protein [Schaalia sp. ZJ405]|uniref:DUF2304 domain-containing protein n=1 Tax=Schaalia sp. ZJ405 TaxID=2709403 RepID=UPI0013EBB178|nr:DUF2304 domain-containing protein [Schaalia sp. ZJ405]QPK81696.1 DUF2304 domain-containing protein [Schaalia sp. ZJ405]
MTSYWLIKALLIVALIVLAYFIVRPPRSANRLAIRRLGTLLILLFAVFAVLFPGLLNRLAQAIGVDRGINLLVYALVIAVFIQMTSAYRRDLESARRLTALARAVALDNVQYPDEQGERTDTTDPNESEENSGNGPSVSSHSPNKG